MTEASIGIALAVICAGAFVWLGYSLGYKDGQRVGRHQGEGPYELEHDRRVTPYELEH